MRESELFLPNAHSNSVISWKAVSVEQKTAIAELVKNNWKISVVDVEQVGAWEIRSNNFRISYTRGIERVQALLRKHIQHASSAAVAAMDEVLMHLTVHKIPVPQSSMTDTEQSIVETEGSLWQLYTFIPGTYYQGTVGQLAEAGAAIGRMHVALSTLSPSATLEELLRSRPNAFLSLADLDALLADAQNHRGKTSAWLKEHSDFLKSQMWQVTAEKLETLPEQIIHADLHP